jgi:hypothetical protein
MSAVHIWADLPRSGLGNKMLVWAEAQVLAARWQTRAVTSGWAHFSLGARLRGEYNKRSYAGQLQNDPLTARVWARMHRARAIDVASSTIGSIPLPERGLYRVHEVPHWADYFGQLRSQRAMLREKFFAMLRANIHSELKNFPIQAGAIHVRMGDFKPLAEGVDFKTVGLTRTPFDYFIDLIRDIRAVAGFALPFQIFSDGHPQELAPLLSIEGLTLAPPARDLVHILAMARARVLLSSAGSTFSQWATFLSDTALTLHHPDHFHAHVRPVDQGLPFEGVSSLARFDWRDTLRAHLASTSFGS